MVWATVVAEEEEEEEEEEQGRRMETLSKFMDWKQLQCFQPVRSFDWKIEARNGARHGTRGTW